MTVRGPFWLQAGEYSAEDFRQVTAALLGVPFASFAGGIQSTSAGGGHGVIGSGDLAVSQNGTPNMSVNVAVGRWAATGTEASDQAPYIGVNDAVKNITISAADATNARKDLIVARVRDSEYSGANDDIDIVVVTGTPAASPADPAVPSNSLVLARVNVPALDTAITNAQIDDLRTRATALGGIVVCTSTTRPSGASLYEGLHIYETDTNKALVYDGSGWVELVKAASWDTYTPTVTQSGAVTKTTTYARYHRVGRQITVAVSLAITGSGTGGNNVTVSLPVTAAQAGNINVGSGTIFDGSVNRGGVVALNTTTTCAFITPGAAGFYSTALANGNAITFTITYEAAS